MFICCFACLGLEFVVVTVVGEWGGGKGEGVFSGRLGGGVQERESFQERTVFKISIFIDAQ